MSEFLKEPGIEEKRMKKKRPANTGKRGSILLEALLSVLIISVSITTIIQSMVSSLRATVFSVDYSKATLLMENKMNDLIIAHETGHFIGFPDEYRIEERDGVYWTLCKNPENIMSCAGSKVPDSYFEAIWEHYGTRAE